MRVCFVRTQSQATDQSEDETRTEANNGAICDGNRDLRGMMTTMEQQSGRSESFSEYSPSFDAAADSFVLDTRDHHSRTRLPFSGGLSGVGTSVSSWRNEPHRVSLDSGVSQRPLPVAGKRERDGSDDGDQDPKRRSIDCRNSGSAEPGRMCD